MTEQESGELRRINWNECFAFTRIFRSFRASLGLTKLLLVFLGIFSTYCVGRLLDGVWAEQSQPLVSLGTSELTVFLGSANEARKWVEEHGKAEDAERVGCFALLMAHGRDTANAIIAGATSLSPGTILTAVIQGYVGVVWLFSMHPLFALLFSVIGLLIWALFGGAACRAAALELTREDLVDWREALTFTRPRHFHFVAGPLIPVVMVLCLALVLFICGLIGWVWGIGDVLFGLFAFPVSLLFGGILAAVLLVTLLCWPLMWPAAATDDQDAMESFSTAVQLVWNRPWKAALYALVAIVFGGICFFFLKLFVTVVLWATGTCTGYAMNWGDAFALDAEGKAVKIESKLDAMWQHPNVTGGGAYYGTFEGQKLRGVSRFGQWCLKFWIYLLTGLVATVVISYFFTASTSIYLLLRREVDGTDWEDVFLEPSTTEGAPPGTQSGAPSGQSAAETSSAGETGNPNASS